MSPQTHSKNKNDDSFLHYMQEAISESHKARGISSPNPPVGAVIYDADGILRGQGHTQQPGGMHAEIAAITQAGEFARGGTLAVTLEPCNHYGRTPPCVQSIIQANLATVIYGVPDSTDLAQGGGKYLRQAGINVIENIASETITHGPLREWLFRQKHNRPYISAKIALSLDGKVTSEIGQQNWLTGISAKIHAHKIRAELDAIVVGTSTVLIDNPQLTARLPEDAEYKHQPLRVVVGDRLIPDNYYVNDSRALTKFFPRSSPTQLLAELSDYNNILLEGGPTLIHQFIRHDLIDRYYLYLVPTILGQGLNAFMDRSVAEGHCQENSIGESLLSKFPQNFIPYSIEQLDKDLCLTLIRDADMHTSY